MLANGFRAFGIALILYSVSVRCQLSKPVLFDEHVKSGDNKFLQRKADEDAFKGFDLDVHRDECPQNIQLRWMTELSSSVYATPLITDLYSDGRKDIVVPSFVHYLEVLEGDGAKSVGWPAFHKSTLHTSPLLYDIDFDGVRDIMVATYNGEILFYKDTGEQLADKLQVPRLTVRKRWYVGLSTNYIDHSHPDVGPVENTFASHAHQAAHNGHHNQGHGGEGVTEDLLRQTFHQIDFTMKSQHGTSPPPPSDHPLNLDSQMKQYRQQLIQYRQKYGQEALQKVLLEVKEVNPELYAAITPSLQAPQHSSVGQAAAGHAAAGSTPSASPTQATQQADPAQSAQGTQATQATQPPQATQPTTATFTAKITAASGDGTPPVAHQRRLMAVEEDPNAAGVELDPRHELTDEAQEAFHSFDDDIITAKDVSEARMQELQRGPPPGVNAPDLPDDDAYDEMGDKVEGVEAHLKDEHGPYDGLFYDDYPDDVLPVQTGSKAWKEDDLWMDDKGWEEETYQQEAHKFDSEMVEIDPHLLCTPSVADIDGDGHEELVVAVSYFFDREYYDDPMHNKELKGIDPSKYIASGIVVFDLATKLVKWVQHLDLSSESTTYKAYMYSSPTLVDIDGDGKMEIIVGTSMGFLYVLDSKGKSRSGWPIQMGEIQGQPLVADLNNDGKIEIFAADNRGSIALFDIDGKEIWERHTRSMVSQMATAGDINGDGELEIVFGTASGAIFAVQGANGEDVHNFPFKTKGKINAPVLITQLNDGSSQQLIVMSFDGHLYVVDGITACADTVDIGETSYSMVVADDLDNNGKLDLVVSTMNGVVYVFETPADYHPLRAWTSQIHAHNGMVSRVQWYGAYAELSSRRPRDVAGEKLQLKINVLDKRSVKWKNGTRIGPEPGPYNLSVVLKGVGVKEMNAGAQPVIGVADTVAKNGPVLVEVPCPRSRTTATIQVMLQDRNGLTFVDEFSLSFHMHFHKLLKWFITLPLGLMVILLLMIKRDPVEESAALPSFHYRD